MISGTMQERYRRCGSDDDDVAIQMVWGGCVVVGSEGGGRVSNQRKLEDHSCPATSAL